MGLLLLLTVFGMVASLESKFFFLSGEGIKINFSPSIYNQPYSVIKSNEQILHVKSLSNQ